jgi:hypothetical protein
MQRRISREKLIRRRLCLVRAALQPDNQPADPFFTKLLGEVHQLTWPRRRTDRDPDRRSLWKSLAHYSLTLERGDEPPTRPGPRRRPVTSR